ncbi:Lipid Phosphate Formation and Regulation [Abortiporus biennis]
MSFTTDTPLELTVGENGKQSKFTLRDDVLHVKRTGEKKWANIQAPLRHVVWAELSNDTLEVSLLAKRRSRTPGGSKSLALVHLTGKIKEEERQPASKFTEALMQAAYQGIKPPRRLKIFVNPHSGPGKAVGVFKKRIEPLFRAARCITDVTFTTHAGHAREIVKTLPLEEYDVIVAMSGDGLIHEILNGFAEHANPVSALRTPIAPIPTGSGNGLALNLLGIEEGCDVSAAALNAAKGRPMTIDLFSVTHKDSRVFSFMSQCVGLMSELDLGTENMRFLGNTRFIVGYIRGIVKHRACPIKLQIKVAESDKSAMLRALDSARQQFSVSSSVDTSTLVTAPEGNAKSKPQNGDSSETLPDLKYRTVNPTEEDGWITFDQPVSYLYAGKGPYVGKDLMQFPVSLPNDGYIDVVVQEQIGRGELLKAMDGAEVGKAYFMNSQHYFKAEAYRVIPHNDSSWLSVDGEKYPFEPFEVEVHKGLATLLSPYGYYKADTFEIPSSE